MNMGSISTRQPAAGAKRTRLLIVDDEPHLARTLQILLGEEHEVEVVTSGSAARERLESALAGEACFDAILCDLSMRDVSGMELFEWLLGHQPAAAQRMIFMTGGAYTARAREFLDRVPNPRVEKPFRLEDLQVLVRRIAQASPTRSSRP